MVRDFVQTDHVRGDDFADRAWVHLAIGMAADAGIDRAMVHAGAAANAVQGLTQFTVGERLAATVIEQHQVHFLRAIQFIGLAWAGDHVDVRGDGDAQRRAGQQRQQWDGVTQVLDDFFDAGHGDMHRRNRGAHAAVAFVFDQQQGAGFSHGEVDTGDADVGFEEFLAQHFATDLDQFVDVFGVVHAQFFVEQGAHLDGVFVNRWHDDVRRFLVVELDDVFAHVRFQAFNATGGEEIIHFHFFADHRLALDHLPGFMSLDDREDNVIGFFYRFRPMHLHAITGQVSFQLLKQIGQLGQGARPNRIAQGAQTFTFVSIAERGRALGHQRVHGGTEVVAQLAVAQGFMGPGAEVFVDLNGGDQCLRAHCPPPVRCHRKLAMCWPRSDSRCFSSEPLMFIKQPQSAVTT